MRPNGTSEKPGTLARAALVGGLSGGIAEIAWVGLYCYLTGLSGAEVARQVVVSVFLPAQNPAAPLLGVVIHLLLSLAVGAVYVLLVWHPFAARCRSVVSVLIAVAVLAAIWAVNFLLLLPALNPGFVDLLPYPVTLASKILFGISMALVLQRARDRQPVHAQGAWRPVAVKSS